MKHPELAYFSCFPLLIILLGVTFVLVQVQEHTGTVGLIVFVVLASALIGRILRGKSVGKGGKSVGNAPDPAPVNMVAVVRASRRTVQPLARRGNMPHLEDALNQALRRGKKGE